ncbi:hypothetical protein JHK84_033205 [Glycine max]|nr:hypothetical protein JHK84_033205 [Glycine max]
MAPSDVCLSEDAVQVFIEHLVDPLLPAKASVQDNPTPSQQKLVANQVRSTVLLYNYYHRKQHPELAYLPFNEFCKLAVVLRPPLLAYMQFMQNLNEEELTDVEKQLSLTEKMIMEACDVCKCLDASKDAPNIEGWPITKVSMLLIDSKKENCFLLFSSITSGVWSVIEKGLDTSSQSSLVEKGLNTSSQSSLVEKGLSTSYQSSEVTSGSKQYKKRRVIKKSAQKELKVDEDVFLQVGYSAVKEATGINNTDIMLLESGTVYSESKEKAASRFYIMQCYRTINEEVIQIPLQVLIKRFVFIAIVLQLSDDSGPRGSVSDDREMGLFPALKVDSTRMLIAEGGVNNLASLHNNYANGPNTSSEKGILVNYTPTANHSNSDLEKLQILSDSKKILSQTALAALIRKRNELALQQRKIEDEIAVCDKKIQRMLTGGFKANVIVKGEDFQCSFEGIMGSNPPEARESAAAQMLTHFKNMAKLAQ